MRRFRLPLLLTGLCLLGAVAVLPLTFEIVAALPNAPTLPPPAVLAGAALLQNLVVFGAASFAGVALARRMGLPFGLLGPWAGEAGPPGGSDRRLLLAGAAGLLTGATVAGLDALLPAEAGAGALASVPLWKRLLAGVLYGGINEEVLTRLFLVSALAWLLARGWRREASAPRPAVMVAAIFAAALLFGLGHLPAVAVAGTLGPEQAFRILALNGLAGCVFGGLYWRSGLDAAMVAHAAAHVPLQLLAGSG